MTATLVSSADRLLPATRTGVGSEEAASLRGALLVSGIAAPVVLLVSAIAHAPSVRADAELAGLLSLLSLGVALPAYLALGGALLAHVRARSSGGARRGALDLAVLAASALVLVGSVAATVVGSDAVFYDVGCVALAVATAGRVLEGGRSGGAAVPAAAAIAAALFALAVRRPEVTSTAVISFGCLAAATLLGVASARSRGARGAAVVAASTAIGLGAVVFGAATLAG